jgi:AraC-like DNA-binding protein
VDPLGEVLRVSRVRAAFPSVVSANGPWGVAVPAGNGAALHAITSGTVWLRMRGRDPLLLHPGDVVMVPVGTAPTIASAPHGPAQSFSRILKKQLMDGSGVIRLGADAGDPAGVICASFDYDHDVSQPLMSALPMLLHIPAEGCSEGVSASLRLLHLELGSRDEPGADTAVNRLVDLLLVHVLRDWLRRQPGDVSSWLRGLTDPTTAAALAHIHGKPQQPWSTDTLAHAVGVSRATLARRFMQLVGQPPLTYLTNWRMDLAAKALRDTGDPVDTIARQVGYTSEYAFSRAFSRSRGMPPGKYRASSRTAGMQLVHSA